MSTHITCLIFHPSNLLIPRLEGVIKRVFTEYEETQQSIEELQQCVRVLHDEVRALKEKGGAER